MKTVDILKRKLISIYVKFLLFVLISYALVFYFFLEDKLFAYFLFFYSGALFYTWALIKKYYPIKVIVHIHLITGLLLASFVMLNYWTYSIALSIWLLPIPFAAYIFLEKKFFYLYSVAVVVVILAVNLLYKELHLDYFKPIEKRALIISDSFILISNLIIFILLLYFYEKIKKAEEGKLNNNSDKSPFETVKTQVINTSYYNAINERSILNFSNPAIQPLKEEEEDVKILTQKEIEKYNILFKKITDAIAAEKYYKDVNFSISQLSSILKTNNLYISTAIKQNGYTSFNHFVNTYRINDVKKRILENDLSKVTLMYIYTECGFSNQSTFNRAFRQVEGITPTEFIKNLSII